MKQILSVQEMLGLSQDAENADNHRDCVLWHVAACICSRLEDVDSSLSGLDSGLDDVRSAVIKH